MFSSFPRDKVLLISSGTCLEPVEKRNSFNGQLIDEYDHKMFKENTLVGTCNLTDVVLCYEHIGNWNRFKNGTYNGMHKDKNKSC